MIFEIPLSCGLERESAHTGEHLQLSASFLVKVFFFKFNFSFRFVSEVGQCNVANVLFSGLLQVTDSPVLC